MLYSCTYRNLIHTVKRKKIPWSGSRLTTLNSLKPNRLFLVSSPTQLKNFMKILPFTSFWLTSNATDDKQTNQNRRIISFAKVIMSPLGDTVTGPRGLEGAMAPVDSEDGPKESGERAVGRGKSLPQCLDPRAFGTCAPLQNPRSTTGHTMKTVST